MAKKWGESGHPLEILFFGIVILWYLQQLNTSPYVYRVQSKQLPLVYWQIHSASGRLSE